MSIREYRNCNCNYQMNNDDNTPYSVSNTSCCEPERRLDCEAREEMLQQIRCLDFAINELALYLDTHPDDQRALCLHRKYCKEAKELKDMFQKMYGPLTIYFPCNKWRWLEEPWPWEGGDF